MPIPASSASFLPLLYDDSIEHLEDDELDTQRQLVETLLGIGDVTYRDSGRGLRSVHAKAHGLLKGELQVLESVQPYAQGLFAAPRRLPVLIRLSTSPGDVLDDHISTPRGFAMKVLDVEGERLPGSEQQRTQDFLLVNGPAFLAPTARKFLASLKLLAATTDRVPRLKRAFSAVLRGTEHALEAAGGESATLKSLGGHPITHPLGETYHSQVPFLYGPYMAKWSVAPVSAALRALEDQPVHLQGPDGLRETITAYFAAEAAEWELRVQLCTDLERMPIEDASVPWPEDLSPHVAVARIIVPRQSAWNAARELQMDDGLAFSPWQGLAAHRPLGSVNRARRPAYLESAQARSPRGRCPIHEPGIDTKEAGHGER